MPDTAQKLNLYLALLHKWQKSINLVSQNTLDESWKRHIEDSLQLTELVPDGAVVFDLGSGGGFPGLVLAMARLDLSVTLIESDTKKCTFLSTVSRETQAPVTIENTRIESVSRETVPDIITARALAPMDKLLRYCLPWAQANPALEMLFLKGRKAAEEIEQARRSYRFDAVLLPSKTSADSHIVKVSNLNIASED